MHTWSRTLSSVEETQAWGYQLGRRLTAPLTIALIGDLGAGKTHLAQAIAAGVGVQEPVTSPTFSVLNAYTSGREPLYHFDLYRLDDASELGPIGFYDYVGRGLCIVEWANRFLEELPRNTLFVDVVATGLTTRLVTLRSTSHDEEALAAIGGSDVFSSGNE